MHVGKEVEGHYQGVRTLFIAHFELKEALARWPECHDQYEVTHLYIMDHGNALTKEDLASLREFMEFLDSSLERVTIEVMSLPLGIDRLPRVNYMVSVEIDPRFLGFAYPSSPFVDGDQIKFTKNLFVACAKASDFVITQPGCFADDIEV